ncbi:beta-agarase [Catenovulum adriaticum]|uniref:Beta-agarase n=1 Tax=Catenovulum adriaticum TaxID=2984846 RepID=A0ABY7AS61_9ALTE|nr:beta-agarase [Catenovulum sp. TS8]WAJ71506.1 beta-agarase [Catenovulum sp. TS8]
MKLKMTTLAALLICLTGCNSTSGSSEPNENKPVVDNTTDAGDNNEVVDQEDNTDNDETTEEPLVINVNEADPRTPSFVSFNDTTPDDMYWVKVEELSDEFDFWDSNKWVKTNWNYGDTPVNMLNKNSGVDGGNLWIKATLNAESENQWFETSRVRSKSKIKFPMYTESRIKTAHISAYNTFWLNNGDIDNRDEIDIIENNSNPSTDYANPDYPWTMHSQYFVVKDGVTERSKGNFDNRHLSEGNTLKGVAWNEEYHVVGAWWKDEHNVQFYLDGEPAGKIKTTNPFTLEQHLIWDLWTQDSSWVGGLPDKNDLLDDSINTMRVDWVRTWRLETK